MLIKHLPDKPDLEHLKKQAKALLQSHRQSSPEAISRIQDFHPRPSGSITLQDAQLVIAREYGFESWPKLAEVVARYGDVPSPTHEFFRAQTNDGVPLSSRLDEFPTAFPKDTVQSIVERVHDEFGSLLSTTLPRFLHQEIRTTTGFLDQGLYWDYIRYQQTRSDSGYACVFTPTPLKGHAAVDFSRGLIGALLDRSPEQLDLSPQDWSTLDAIYQHLWTDLGQAWSLITPIEIDVSSIDNDPSSLKIADPDDVVIDVGLYVSRPEWWITFCYPNALLQQVRSQLEEQGKVWTQSDQL